MSRPKMDVLDPTEADRLAAVRHFLSTQGESQADIDGTTIDGNTATMPDGFSFWVVTRAEVKAAGLWNADLDRCRLDGVEWVIMPL